VREITQPKHLVTTQRNFPILTRSAIRTHQKNLVRLRRTSLFESVRGGCVSVELTNESRGWHLHAHWLLDVRWLDVARVAATWGQIVGQSDGSIIKIQDVRGSSYITEVSKYVCKGSEAAGWSPDELNQFIRAIHGCRFFFSFGTLFKRARIIRARLKLDREIAVCDCGSSDFVWCDETTEVVREITQRHR
jgi:hypothetical protein